MPGLNPSDQDIEQFIQITSTDRSTAEHFLQTGTTLEGALEDFFATSQAQESAPIDLPAEDELEGDLDLDGDDEYGAGNNNVEMSDNTDQQQQQQQQHPPTGGPRTLGGQAVDDTLPAGWGQPERRTGRIGEAGGGQSARRPGEVATLFNTGVAASMQRGGPGGPGGPGGDDDDDDDDDDRRRQEFYTGGERSGLAVEGPDRGAPRGDRSLVQDILRQAAGNTPKEDPRAAGSASSQTPSAFRGAGNTLGSDESPSVAVPATGAGAGAGAGPGRIAAVTPSVMDNLLGGMFGGGGGAGGGAGAGPSVGASGARQAPGAFPGTGSATNAEDDSDEEGEGEGEAQTRNLTFWRNGFSIEDGPLMAYDAPGNREILQAIQSGRAPPSLFGVRYNQPLQVVVAQRTNEDYTPPPKVHRNFGGEGNRLGNVAPVLSPAGSGRGSPAPAPAPARAAQQQQQGGESKGFELDPEKPSTSIQIRLADGSKLVAKVNLTHTVGDLRSYITASSTATRPFVIQTTFPSKVLEDDSATIQEAGLANAVVVQRYT